MSYESIQQFLVSTSTDLIACRRGLIAVLGAVVREMNRTRHHTLESLRAAQHPHATTIAKVLTETETDLESVFSVLASGAVLPPGLRRQLRKRLSDGPRSGSTLINAAVRSALQQLTEEQPDAREVLQMCYRAWSTLRKPVDLDADREQQLRQIAEVLDSFNATALNALNGSQ